MRLRNGLRSVIHRMWPPKPRPLILGYHRIVDDPVDHWQLAVSPAHFEEQLEVLCRTRYPIPLTDFFRDLVAGTLRSDAVSLTFDDGYVDNLIAGKPRLAKASVPATVFLVTGYLDRPGEFWWDELARLILRGNGPSSIELVVGGKPMHFDFGAGSLPSEALGASTTRRDVALRAIWQALRRLEDEERGSVMRTVRSMFASTDHEVCRGRAMTSEEVKTLVSDGLVAIGSHTVTHPLLSELGAAACRREISESKLTCEKLVGASVASFAYPFGGFNAVARDEVRGAGFVLACSSQHGPAVATSDAFVLPRINVQNWDGDLFERAIRSAALA